MRITIQQLKTYLLPSVAIAAGIALFIGIVGGALHDPKPKNIPVAIVADDQLTTQLQKNFDTALPNTLSLKTYKDANTAKNDLRTQTVLGVVEISNEGLAITAASANTAAPGQVVNQAFSALAQPSGIPVQYTDSTPKASNASHMVLLLFLVLLGTISAIALQGAIARKFTFVRWKIATVIGSIVIAAVSVGMLRAFGEFSGAIWQVMGIATLYLLVLNFTAGAAYRLFGKLGIATAAILFVPFGIAASGVIVSPLFLPGFYQGLGNFLPSAAAVDAIRQATYFNSTNITQPLLILTAWAFAGSATAAGYSYWLRRKTVGVVPATKKAPKKTLAKTKKTTKK